MPTVEDYFDDDTDLPLPSSSRHLPNTGQRGALVSEIDDEGSDEELDMANVAEQSRGIFGEDATAPPASGSGKGKMTMRDEPGGLRPGAGGPGGGNGGMPQMNPNTPMGGFMGDMMKLERAEQERLEKLRKQFGNTSVAADPSVYKGWNTVYPLYFDAKRSVQDGRRIARKSAMWWPQATQISKGCRTLGLPCVLEPDRCHPADWENPGRVKVQISQDGNFFNPIVKNRTQLYQQLAAQMQHQSPSDVYKPRPKRPAEQSGKATTDKKSKKGSSAQQGKGKAAQGKNKKKPARSTTIIPLRLPTRPPLAPQPLPTLEDRLPLHSPVHPTGVAVSAVKRDLENEKENKKKGIGGGGDEGKEKMPKMKRVVVRGPKR